MRRMRNYNLEIRITDSSCRPQLRIPRLQDLYFLPMVDVHRYPLSSSLTCAVNTSSCYTCVNNLGPVQVFEPPCCGKALTFSNSGKLSIKTRQRNLVAVTQRNVITRTCIFEAMITSFCFADSYTNTNKCLNISENVG